MSKGKKRIDPNIINGDNLVGNQETDGVVRESVEIEIVTNETGPETPIITDPHESVEALEEPQKIENQMTVEEIKEKIYEGVGQLDNTPQESVATDEPSNDENNQVYSVILSLLPKETPEEGMLRATSNRRMNSNAENVKIINDEVVLCTTDTYKKAKSMQKMFIGFGLKSYIVYKLNCTSCLAFYSH